MSNNLIFIPVLIQILLTFCLYIALAKAKNKAVNLNQVNEERRALHDDAWPDFVLQINNCIRNQFEVPVLFYVLVILAWLTSNINMAIYVLAWAFVISRIVHAAIHTGNNFVPLRRKVFMLGCLLLMGFALFLSYALIVTSIF